MQHVSPVREPLVTGGKTYHDITQDVCRQVEAKPNIRWMAALAVALFFLGVFLYSVYRTLWYGIGEWGLNKTVGWAW
ncbi:hydrogenase, partial [Hymenobacter defluvii]|nr:hydrogenase [Hymenobacter defluvii]